MKDFQEVYDELNERLFDEAYINHVFFPEVPLQPFSVKCTTEELRAWEANQLPFALTITDMVVPEGKGIKTARQVELLNGLKLIIWTSAYEA